MFKFHQKKDQNFMIMPTLKCYDYRIFHDLSNETNLLYQINPYHDIRLKL